MGMKISDLIVVPEIRTVIQLVDATSAEEEKRRELLDTFVLTDEIANHFLLLLSSFLEQRGAGCFLKGHYGSGKTHFLSFVSLLLKDPQGRARYLPEGLFPPQLGQKRFFVVNIPLFLFPAAKKLDEIVLGSCEESLHSELGRFETLGGKTKLLENFNTFILPQAQDFLMSQKLEEEEWLALCRNDGEKATYAALEYLSTLKSNPLKVHYDWKDAFERLHVIIREHNYDGLVLIIDELSEFLKSKPEARMFNEDVRFLQFLGEWTANNPLWVIASLQEGIEEVGHIEENLYRRIKDRYRLRFSLTNRHLESLIEKRVLIKKPESRELIGSIYRKVIRAFPWLGVTEEYFYKIYPVHPATLTMLENLMGLFSQHRGVVDFLYTMVRGDRGRSAKGILDESTDRLLTCDAIFDHFKEKLREIAELAPYYNVAYRSISGDIPAMFEEEKDREIAERLVKIMILSELSPLEKRKTAKLLADLTLLRISSIDSSLNYEYLRENVLERLVNESSYVKREAKGTSALDTIYFVDLTTNINQLVNSRTREVLRTLDDGAHVWMSILSQMNMNHLPLLQFISESPVHSFIKWEFTPREGWITLRDLTSFELRQLQSLEKTLHSTEKEFILLIGTPVSTAKQADYLRSILTHVSESRYAPTIIGWIPKELDNKDREALLTTYAHIILRDQAMGKPDEKEIAEHLAGALDKELAYLHEIITRSYFQGDFYNPKGLLTEDFHNYGFIPFNILLLRLLSPGLEKLYPLHKDVKPHGEEFHQHQLEKACGLFFDTGKMTAKEAEARGIIGTLESTFVPLGLAKRSAGSFLLTIEPSRNKLLAEFMKYVIPGKSVVMGDIYLKLRKGPYGLIRPLFNLVSAALLHSGFLTAYREGRLVGNPGISKIYSFAIDSLGEGRILEKEYQALLPAGVFLWGEDIPLSPFTMAVQRTLWDQGVKSLESMRKKLQDFIRLIERYREYQVFSYLSIEEISRLAESLLELPESVSEGLESRKGLEKIALFLQSNADYHSKYEDFERYHKFFTNQLEGFQRIRGILANPSFFVPNSEEFVTLFRKKKGLLDSLGSLKDIILGGKWEEYFGSFNSFYQEYVECYRACHDEFYRHQYFGEWRSIRSSLEYGMLLRLSRLFSIQVSNDGIKVHRLFEEVPRECSHPVREELEVAVQCSCGYRLDNPLRGEPPMEITKTIRTGIDEYLDALSSSTHRENIENYIEGLKVLGKTELISHLKKILDAKGKPLPEIASHLDDEVIASLNKALSGGVLILERDIDGLHEKLVGRRFSLSGLSRILESWLQGEPSEGAKPTGDTLIHIISGRNRDDFSLWDGYLTAREIVKEEGQRLIEAFWVTYFLEKHGLSRDSLFLSTRYKIDNRRLEELMTIGDQGVAAGRFEEIAQVEKRLAERGEIEALAEEFALSTKSLEELISFLIKDSNFLFISKMAAQRIMTHLEGSGKSDCIAKALYSLEKIEGWGEIMEILCSYIKLLKVYGELDQEEDIIARYTKSISEAGYLAEKLKALQLYEELIPGSRMRDIEKNAKDLIKDYTKAFHQQVMEGKAQSVKDFIPVIYAPVKKSARQKFILIFDGMRWDLWERLLPSFAAAFPLRDVKVIPLVAIEPTDTATNRPWLTGTPMDEYEGELEGEKLSLAIAGESPAKREKMEAQLTLETAPVKVIHFNFIDERIHKSTTTLYLLYEELSKEFDALVLPWLKRIDEKAIVFVLSDHGFSFDSRRKTPYTHGGNTPFEKIVPCAIFKREARY